MVVYPNDAMCWLEWKIMKGYVSWGVYNILLTPAHDWIYNCIQDWTWKWDPVLMTSTVWPNRRQGIITMLSSGTVGQFRKPAPRRRGTKLKDSIGAKIPNSCFYTFPNSCVYTFLHIFGESVNPDSTLLHTFEGLTAFRQRVPKIQVMLGLIPCYGLVKQKARHFVKIKTICVRFLYTKTGKFTFMGFFMYSLKLTFTVGLKWIATLCRRYATPPPL